MIRSRHFFFSCLCLASAVLAGCAPPPSSVSLTLANGRTVSLRALDACSRDGKLSGPDSSAWFYFRSGLLGSPESSKTSGSAPSRSLEVTVVSPEDSPVTLSLALVSLDDIAAGGSLVRSPVPRSLARVSSVRGTARVSIAIPPSGPYAAPGGFAARLEGGPGASSTVLSASVRPAGTGWDRSGHILGIGFPPEGGLADVSALRKASSEPGLLPVVLAPGSRLSVSLSASPAASPDEPGTVRFAAGNTVFSLRKTPAPFVTSIPAFFFGPGTVSVRTLSGGDCLAALTTAPLERGDLIASDPSLILDWPQASWRRNDREVFAWDRFPSVLIFDTASYAVQDRLFKRLAFFAEKQGYRGKLWTDEDLAGQHAYNAHDYRAESLADFFEKARAENFPLNGDELELRQLLLDAGVILKQGNGYRAGSGAVISVSRESARYLRFMFIAHEGYHGIYFVDPDFRAFVSGIYASMDSRAIRYLETYFSVVGSLGYDTGDRYLMENEFMAYLLQQPLDRVASYFTGTINERFLRYGGDPALAEYVVRTDAAEFVRAAGELNGYVYARWGLSGGRTGLFSGE